MNEYALYEGEELLSMGTAKEIAKEMGIQVSSVYFYQTPTHKKRLANSKNPDNARVLVRLDDDGEVEG